VCFWGDDDGSRYRESYFDVYPGVWRHGDWVVLTERGSLVIHGRSDSTLNRGGVRMGTSEFYRIVEALEEVSDSLVVDTGGLAAPGKLWLFVVLREGAALGAELVERINGTLRRELSPRHVPDAILQVAAVPKTLNGKKLEVPVKRILNGVPVARAVNLGTLSTPAALDAFVALSPPKA
jgi:acetoacetyl-CoA synthetase